MNGKDDKYKGAKDSLAFFLVVAAVLNPIQHACADNPTGVPTSTLATATTAVESDHQPAVDGSYPPLTWFVSQIDHNPKLLNLQLRNSIDPTLPTLADALDVRTEMSASKPIGGAAASAFSFAGGSLATSLALNLPMLIKQLIKGKSERKKQTLLREAEYAVAKAELIQSVSDLYFERLNKRLEIMTRQVQLNKLAAGKEAQEKLIQLASTRKGIDAGVVQAQLEQVEASITEAQYQLNVDNLALLKSEYDMYVIIGSPYAPISETSLPLYPSTSPRLLQAQLSPAAAPSVTPQQPSSAAAERFTSVQLQVGRPTETPGKQDSQPVIRQSMLISPGDRVAAPMSKSTTTHTASLSIDPVEHVRGNVSGFTSRTGIQYFSNGSVVRGWVESRHDRPQAVTVSITAYDANHYPLGEWNEVREFSRYGIFNFEKTVSGVARHVEIEVYDARGEKVAEF